MATKRRAEAIWREDHALWDVKVQKDGVRKHFTSTVRGRKGKHLAEARADDWLETGAESMQAKAAWDQYLADIKENKSTSMYTRTESVGRLYICPVLGRMRLESITPAIWQKAITSAAKAGLSRRSCVNVRAEIVAFLKYCRLNRWEHERLEDGDLTIPRSAPAARPKHALTDYELQTVFSDPNIIHYGKPHQAHYIHAFRFLIVTGLRRGELCGLKHSDITGNTLTVSRSINTHNEITQGKTDNARRSFVLTSTMQNILKDQAEYLESMGIRSDWIFPDAYGERPDPNQVYDHWRTYCTQHNMQCSLHELRHTFISLTKSDLPMELLKAQVGHSTAMDTALIYGHEVDGDRERAASIIEATIQSHLQAPQKVGAKTGAKEKEEP